MTNVRGYLGPRPAKPEPQIQLGGFYRALSEELQGSNNLVNFLSSALAA